MRNMEPPAKSKMAARGSQNGRRGLESGLPHGVLQHLSKGQLSKEIVVQGTVVQGTVVQGDIGPRRH